MENQKSFHVRYLSEELARRVRANPHYSLRSFARDLEVAPSWLSEFLSCKKGLSLKAATRFVDMLGISHKEAELFLVSVQAHHARNPSERVLAQKKLQDLKETSTYQMKETDFNLIGSWFHQAILEMTELKDFSHTETEIAQRLEIPLASVQRAVQDLQTAGLLEIKENKMRAVFEETSTTSDISSAAIGRYHEQILQKGTAAIREQSALLREFNSVTFAFDSNRVKEAKKALREFQKKFTDEFYSGSVQKNSIYQMSFQFFRLDQKKVEGAS